jgi:glycosyltransferase involved in cell wall biosynthesis
MQVVLSLSPGGTERLVIELCTRLQPWVDSTVCCLDTPGAWAAELETIGIPVFALGRSPGFHPSLSLQIARLIATRQVDVLHCHHYSPYVYGLLASKIRPARVVYTEHGRLSDAAPSRKRQLVNPMLTRLGGRVFSVSGALKEHMAAEGFPRRSVDVVYNGVDPGRPVSEDDRSDARRSLGLADQDFVIGTAGRLDPVKNLTAMLEACALLRQRYPNTQAVIVGDGAEMSKLQATTAALGITKNVRFTGYRADVRALMPAFDVYLNCSSYEGISLTILEAMACGLPVIASPVGGNPEVVLEGETGLLIQPAPGSIVCACVDLARDEPRRRKMGDAGRRRVEERFSISRMVNEYAGVYFGPSHTTMPTPISVPAPAEITSVTDATRSLV